MIETPAKEVMGTKEAAKFLGLHPVTMLGLAPTLGRKVGRLWKFTKRRLLEYLEAGEPALQGGATTASSRTAAALGTAISTSAPGRTPDASSAVAARPTERKRGNGAPGSRTRPGGRHV